MFSPGVPLFTCLRFLPVRGLPLIQVSECVYAFLFFPSRFQIYLTVHVRVLYLW